MGKNKSKKKDRTDIGRMDSLFAKLDYRLKKEAELVKASKKSKKEEPTE